MLGVMCASRLLFSRLTSPGAFALQPEDLAKNLNFYSISSDGRVTLWTLAKSNLEYSDLMKLKLEPSAMSKSVRCGTVCQFLVFSLLCAAPFSTDRACVAQSTTDMDEEDSHLMGLAGGCCFDFSKLSQHLFLVGTEEGSIHKCSKVRSQALSRCCHNVRPLRKG